MATDYTPLDLLIAGLISHGFRETELAQIGWRKFDRLGRETRWVRELDCQLVVGDNGVEEYPPWQDIGLWIPEGSDQHNLLRKCGQIYLRTRERAEYRELAKSKPQRELSLSADQLLDEL